MVIVHSFFYIYQRVPSFHCPWAAFEAKALWTKHLTRLTRPLSPWGGLDSDVRVAQLTIGSDVYIYIYAHINIYNYIYIQYIYI